MRFGTLEVLQAVKAIFTVKEHTRSGTPPYITALHHRGLASLVRRNLGLLTVGFAGTFNLSNGLTALRHSVVLRTGTGWPWRYFH